MTSRPETVQEAAPRTGAALRAPRTGKPAPPAPAPAHPSEAYVVAHDPGATPPVKTMAPPTSRFLEKVAHDYVYEGPTDRVQTELAKEGYIAVPYPDTLQLGLDRMVVLPRHPGGEPIYAFQGTTFKNGAEDVRVAWFDPEGVGRRQYEVNRAQVRAELEDIREVGKVHVAGHSLGGADVAYALRDNPDLIESATSFQGTGVPSQYAPSGAFREVLSKEDLVSRVGGAHPGEVFVVENPALHPVAEALKESHPLTSAATEALLSHTDLIVEEAFTDEAVRISDTPPKADGWLEAIRAWVGRTVLGQ